MSFRIDPRTARSVYLWHLAGRDTQADMAEAVGCAGTWIAQAFVDDASPADCRAVIAAADPAQRAYGESFAVPQADGWTPHDGSTDDIARTVAYHVVRDEARRVLRELVLDSIAADEWMT